MVLVDFGLWLCRKKMYTLRTAKTGSPFPISPNLLITGKRFPKANTGQTHIIISISF